MKIPRFEAEDHRRIDAAAADWLVRGERGLNASEQDDFFRWLAEDPRHGEYFARHRQTWRELNALAQWRPEHSQEPNPDLLAGREKFAASSRARWSPPLRFFWMGAGALAAAAYLSLSLWLGGERGGPPADPAAPTSIAAGCVRKELADGSVAELNRGAAMTVAFTDGERRIVLQNGEAHFTVAKDATRPFIVQVGGVDVRAIGTAFHVRLLDEKIEVVVTEGQVSVQPEAAALREVAAVAAGEPRDPVLVSGGQRVVLSRKTDDAAAEQPTVENLSPERVEQVLAWMPRLLDFEARPLAEVVAVFNRHNQTKLVLADPELASLQIFASIRSDNLESLILVLENSRRVRVERGAGTLTLHRPF